MTESTKSARPIAIVSGGSRGIGKAIVLRLARAGLDVRFTYLNNEQAASAVVDELRGEGHVAHAARVDSRDIAASAELVEKTIADAGRLDVLVNNAGITADKLLPMMSDAEWSSVLVDQPERPVRREPASGRAHDARARRTHRQSHLGLGRERHPRPDQLLRGQVRDHRLHARAGEGDGAVGRVRERGRARVHRHRHAVDVHARADARRTSRSVPMRRFGTSRGGCEPRARTSRSKRRSI